MGALIEKLFGGGGPLVSLDTSGACSSKCCDEVSESSDSVISPHTVLTHESWHEPTADKIFTTDPPHEESSIPNEAKTNEKKCESGSCAQGLEVLGDHGNVENMKF